ncbi:MAG TPA: tetratricopeptide repeat protein [Terracidiphilus sp.]|jgi:DNA-binding winged helix-turn-helix (wHTH) protein/tetratricopeptide (TPR) repeat protein
MDTTAAPGRVFRFGLFEADPAASTLTRNGVRVKIQDQPFQILTRLLERPGEVVTREELRQSLWPEGTYIDFDGSLNVILKRLRNTLDDDPENPRFIETVPRRGYRFIAPVSVIEKVPESSLHIAEKAPISVNEIATEAPADSILIPSAKKSRDRHFVLYAAPVLCLLLLVITAALARRDDRPRKQTSLRSASVRMRKSVAVLGFRNLSGRSEDGWLATTLAEMLSTELAGGEQLRLVSGEDVANFRASDPLPAADTLDRSTSARIGGALNSDVLVLGSYMVIGSGDHGQLRLDVRMQDGATGEILSEVAEVGGTQDLFRVVSQIGARLRNRLGVDPLQGTEQAGVLAALPLDRDAARFYSLGVAKLRQFDALGAKDLLEEAAAMDPKFSMVHAMLARAWAQLGYEQKHQEEAKKAFDLSADLPRAERLLVEGEYYESLGKEEQAASVYHALFELFPDNVDYGLRLAAAQTQSGHGAQAMEVIGQLRALRAPVSDDPRIDLAEARAMKDNKPAELVIVRTAVRKASDRGQKLLYALARKEECMILIYGEQPDQGPPACEDAYNIFLGAGNRVAAADAIRLMADGVGAQGHRERAIETYRRALTLLDGLGEHEKTASALNNMAINYANEGDLDHAEQLYRKARLEFQAGGDRTGQLTAIGNIADILFLRGNLSGAEKLYQEALQISSSVDNSEPAYIYYRLADLSLARGKVGDARRLAQKAIDIYAPIHGGYSDLSMALIELGEVLEAQADVAGAHSQFEQALALQQKMGQLELAAESHAELASLAIEEGHGDQAESLVRSALGEFEKEKSDPDASSAYTILSRALLQERKLDEARKAAQRGAELSLTSSDPSLRLPADIQQARIEMAAPGEESVNLATAMRRLHSVITTAKRLGYYNLECEGRLALGELELKVNSSLGVKQLKALAGEARSRGYELVARHAENAVSTGAIVAENRPIH